MMARILVVDDEVNMRRILTVLLTRSQHEVTEADGLTSARKLLLSHTWDVVLTDQRLGDGDGIDLVAACAEIDLSPPVIMLTAFGSVDLAVHAMRQGAFDFITKPFDPDVVVAAVNRACQHAALLRDNIRLKDEVQRLSGFDELVGDSPPMSQLRDMLHRVAVTDATVLITGETGTGKELVARAIHRSSRRADSPFVAVNCAALPETLLESQLFGHERGAFTGADRVRTGLFEAANGGTLFLDEAGEMPPALQAKLLRVLVDHEIIRVGATTPRKVDVRILVATHRNLQERVREGSFREDLYYRLAVVPIAVPALREHPEDLPALVAHFLRQLAEDLKVPQRSISAEALDRLRSYKFPGNVRELRNILERAYILGRHAELSIEDFPESLSRISAAATTIDSLLMHLRLPGEPIDLRSILENVERELIIGALASSGGAQAEAARRLGISRSDLAYKVNKHNLRPHLS
jgi:DNA-binding NtrC family response regulator